MVIPSGTPFVATIGSSTSVNDLTVQPGANLSLGDINLNVTGNLDASGSVAGCCGDFIALSGSTVRGNFDQVVLSVSPGEVVTLNGATTLTNSTVQLAGELILNGNTLNVGQGTVSTINGTGLLTMTNPADQVFAGFIDFSGGDEDGPTDGGRHPHPESQPGRNRSDLLPDGRQPQGDPRRAFDQHGELRESRQLAVPGAGRDRRIRDADPWIQRHRRRAADLAPSSANGPTITGTGVTLTAGGADVRRPQRLHGAHVQRGAAGAFRRDHRGFSRVTFQNQNPVGTALTVNNVGQATPYHVRRTWSSPRRSPPAASTCVANDLDGATPNALTIDMSSTPRRPRRGREPGQSTTAPSSSGRPTGSNFTWTARPASDWFDRRQLGPERGAGRDRQRDPGADHQPAGADHQRGVNNLTSTTGSILDLNGFVLAANGNVDLAGSIIDGVGGGGVTLTGSGKQVRGTINTEVVVVGSYV